MRVLLDENLPLDFAADLPGHDVQTVRGRGWTGIENGELMRLAAKPGDVFITMDQNLPRQQSVAQPHRTGSFICVRFPQHCSALLAWQKPGTFSESVSNERLLLSALGRNRLARFAR
jgi:hypothetical protein